MKSFLFVSQVYVPDPASVGQHVADAAEELAARGHRVTVLTSARGYEDPSARYPSRERRNGVDVIRLPWSSGGKTSILARMLGGIVFLAQAIVRAAFLPRFTALIVSTSPPMAGIAGLVIARLRRARFHYWIMDLNPDQIVVTGGMSASAIPVRIFDWFNRLVLRGADTVVVLDRFMGDRVLRKTDVRAKLHVLPPWPLESVLQPVPHAENQWRREHGIRDELVVMYSGNHSPSNPLSTILDAARRLATNRRIQFYFIGGGSGKRAVEALVGDTVHSLPYQPLDTLAQSLSAADIHVVTIGNEVVGVVHPCKVYGAMAVARPVLAVSPKDSHLGDLVRDEQIGWRVDHGAVNDVVDLLERALQTRDQLTSMGGRGLEVIAKRLSKTRLCGDLCDIFEEAGTADE